MEKIIARKEYKVHKINRFYLLVMLWSIFVQFLPIPPNAYQFIAFLIPITIYLFKYRKSRKRILKLNLLNIQSVIIIIFIWFFTLPLLTSIIDLYIHFFGDALADVIVENSHSTFMTSLFFTAITPAILEEILMRGIVLDGYRNKSRFIAALMNGFLFGMLHLNSFQFAHTFILGFIASYLVFATNSIYAGMLIHLINNSFPVVFEYLYPPDPNAVSTDDIANTNLLNNIVPVMFSIISIYILIKLLASINKIDFRRKRSTSNETVFNKPLIISIVLFLFFSSLIIYTMKTS